LKDFKTADTPSQLNLTALRIDRHTAPVGKTIDIEETCGKLASWRASRVIFSEMEKSKGEISTLPISLHKMN
jgi:hypothetical protein